MYSHDEGGCILRSSWILQFVNTTKAIMLREVYPRTRIWILRIGKIVQTLVLQSLSKHAVDYLSDNLGLFLNSQNSDVKSMNAKRHNIIPFVCLLHACIMWE